MDKSELIKHNTLDVMTTDMCFEIMYSYSRAVLEEENSPGTVEAVLLASQDMLDSSRNLLHAALPEQDKTIPIMPEDKVASRLKAIYANKEVTPIFFKWSKNIVSSPNFQNIKKEYTADIKNITSDFPAKSYLSKVIDVYMGSDVYEGPIGKALIHGDVSKVYVFLKSGVIRNWLMYFGSFQSYNKLLPYAIVTGLTAAETFATSLSLMIKSGRYVPTKKYIIDASEILNPLTLYKAVLEAAGYDPKTLEYKGVRRDILSIWDDIAAWIQVLDWEETDTTGLIARITERYKKKKLPEMKEIYLRKEPAISKKMTPLKAPLGTISLPKDLVSKSLTLSFTDKVEHGKLSHLEKEVTFIESKPMNPIFVPPEPEMEERILVPAPKERNDIVVEIIEPKIKEPRREKPVRPKTVRSLDLTEVYKDSEVCISKYLVDCKFSYYLKSNPLDIPYQHNLSASTKTYPEASNSIMDCKVVDLYGNTVYETVYIREKLMAAISLLNKSLAGLPVDIHKLHRKAGAIEKTLATQLVIALYKNCSKEINTHNILNLSTDMVPYIIKRNFCNYGFLYKDSNEPTFRVTKWLEFLVRNGDLLLDLKYPEYIPLLSRVYSWVIFNSLIHHSRSMLSSRGFDEPEYDEGISYKLEHYERWPYNKSAASAGFSISKDSNGELLVKRIMEDKVDIEAEKTKAVVPAVTEPETIQLPVPQPQPVAESTNQITKEEEDLMVSAISKICRLHKIPLSDRMASIQMILKSYTKG